MTERKALVAIVLAVVFFFLTGCGKKPEPVVEFDSPGEVVLRQARYEFFDYDPEFLQRYQENVTAVTAGDVQEAARRVFQRWSARGECP